MNRPEIHPKHLTKTLLCVCDPTRAVQLAMKGGEIIETTSKGDHDRGRFGHCFELWCLCSKERDCDHQRRDNRLLEINRSISGLKKLKKSIASP